MTSSTAFTDNLHPADGVVRSSHALRGASLAFSSPLANVEQSLNTYRYTTGALAAASAVGSKTTPTGSGLDRPQEPPRLRRSHGAITENRTDGGRRIVMQQQSRRAFSSSFDPHDTSKVMHTDGTKREQAPSYIAAVMAAKKAIPVHGQGLHSMVKLDSYRPSPVHRHSDHPTSHTPNIPQPADYTSIAPTNALVQLYESIQNPDASTPEACQRNDDPLIASPTPIRPPATRQLSIPEPCSYGRPQEIPKNSGNTTSTSIAYSSIGAAAAAVKLAKTAAPRTKPSRTSEARISNPVPSRMTAKRPALPKHQQRQEVRIAESPSPSSSSSYVSAIDKLASSGKVDSGLHDGSNDVDAEVQPADSQQTNLQIEIPVTFLPHKQATSRPVYNKSSRSFDGPVYRSTPSQLHPPTLSSASLVPQLTANSLANAMVASSLASSRAPSPTKLHLPPPRRHGKAHSLFHRSQSTEEMSRTPSPAKQMRQTLRTAKKGEEEEEELYKAKRTHFMKKHPNKHHEGDRKRWRDSVSEAERKRYEGVWAANKNLLHPPEAIVTSQTPVLDIVVRDIWRRSRLPDDVLEEIWNLVNMAGGALGKDEFVVGMWLIDQRLRGRKLPLRVSESVWGSVRMLSGIKLPKHRK